MGVNGALTSDAKPTILPSVHVAVRLDFVRLPDGADWLVNKAGLVVGVRVTNRSVIGLAPAALPRMSFRKLYVFVDYAAEEPLEAKCRLGLLYLDASYQGVGLVSDEELSCDSKRHFVFDVPTSTLDSILTAGLDVEPTVPGKPVVVRAMWAEAHV